MDKEKEYNTILINGSFLEMWNIETEFRCNLDIRILDLFESMVITDILNGLLLITIHILKINIFIFY